MQIKYSWIIIVVVQLLSVFKVKGQELERDTVFINSSILEKNKLQLAQPSLPFEKPELDAKNIDLQAVPIDKSDIIFNLKRVIKYPHSLSADSPLLFLPAYPGLSDYQNFGGSLGNFNISNKLTLDYGAFISAQYGYLFSSKQIVFGGNCLLQYAITNKLQLKIWGQYLAPENSSDPTFNITTIFPTTNIGTGLQYNSNENTRIKVGVEYQYDLSDKTWKAESGGKVLFKF